ncbi:MAG TPA: hypothetical protein VHS05_19635 [Pyrinomonadaceae bacterium]|jgi:hypothetical protein|nr:hypothetical protein [Pyrinomonadaceae bacterium]
MSTEREKIQARRKALRREYGELYDRLSRLLFERDPIGINFEHNTDEYEPEVDTILPRLHSCTGPEDVRRVVHEEFCAGSMPTMPARSSATNKSAATSGQ